MNPATIVKLNNKNQLVFQSSCPEHFKNSSIIRGRQLPLLEGPTLWVFKCRERGGHLFLAEACSIDPKTPEERDAVVSRLLSEKAVKVGRGQQ